MQTAIAYGLLGSLDANTGDPQTGWDTDQFLTDPLESTRIALAIVKNGGIAPGPHFRHKPRNSIHMLRNLMCTICRLHPCLGVLMAHGLMVELFAGGINFDAKLRRESTDVADLFYGHISGIDAMAFGLRKAAAILEVILQSCFCGFPMSICCPIMMSRAGLMIHEERSLCQSLRAKSGRL